MEKILYKRDNNKKIRQVHIWTTETTDPEIYTIHRESGCYEGKQTPGPDIVIDKGKAKRTVLQQCELQFNSAVKVYKDKGYIEVEGDVNTSVPMVNKDQNGAMKPMLCKVYEKDDKKSQAVKLWYISRKHDGLRMFIYMRDNQIHTSSRGGSDYDIPAQYILNDPFIKKLFEKEPNLILDGEIYRHGWPLSKISGLCRLDNLTEEHEELHFHCYDIADESLTFADRLQKLRQINKAREAYPDSKLIIVDHYPVKTYEDIMKMHDKFVAEGYEGAVIRDPSQCYKFGARDRRMQKIKIFTDNEFKIKGLVEGLRDEDLCFLMETKEGYEFKAKPIGDRVLKQYYREHIDEMIGKMATVKHFGWTTTDKPVPNLPVWKALRDKKDM